MRTAAAQQFAHAAHNSIGQKRKYTGAPYGIHTDAVAATVASIGGSADMIVAAHLHDVIEDVAPLNIGAGHPFGIEAIRAKFGKIAASYVMHLTDVFTRNYAWINRAQRKALEANRLSLVPNDVKTIKLADLIDNIGSIMTIDDPKFAKIYMAEKARLLPRLVGGNAELLARASALVAEYYASQATACMPAPIGAY